MVKQKKTFSTKIQHSLNQIKSAEPYQSKIMYKSGLKDMLKTKRQLKRLNINKQSSHRPGINYSNPGAQLIKFLQKQHIMCPICFDYCYYPILTQCGHYYCLYCFQNAHKKQDKCCICRGQINIEQYQPSIILQQLFQAFVSTEMDWVEAQVYWSYLRVIKKVQSKRNISSFIKIGDKVDIKVSSRWIQGQVISMGMKQIQIQYKDYRTQQLTRIIKSKKSRALASQLYFSRVSKVQTKTKTAAVRRAVVIYRQTVGQLQVQPEVSGYLNQPEIIRRGNWEQENSAQVDEDNRWMLEESEIAANIANIAQINGFDLLPFQFEGEIIGYQ